MGSQRGSCKPVRRRRRKARRLGPYSKAIAVESLDRRTQIGRQVEEIRQLLLAQLRNPTVQQQMLVSMVAFTWARFDMLAQRVLIGKGRGKHGDDQVLAYQNSVVRMLRELGPAEVEPSDGGELDWSVLSDQELSTFAELSRRLHAAPRIARSQDHRTPEQRRVAYAQLVQQHQESGKALLVRPAAQ